VGEHNRDQQGVLTQGRDESSFYRAGPLPLMQSFTKPSQFLHECLPESFLNEFRRMQWASELYFG
jgi:hypothetical protein